MHWQAWQRPERKLETDYSRLSIYAHVRSVCPFVRPSMSEPSIPALSTNGAEQDLSTFMYGVWITNLSNSHVDIKEDNINTTSIHRLQNLNVLLMRSPFPARIHQVCFIPFSVRRFSGTSEDLRTRGQEESYSKSAEYRASGTPRASGPLPLHVLHVLPSLSIRDRPKCFGQLSRCNIKIPILTPSIFSDDRMAANMRQGGQTLSYDYWIWRYKLQIFELLS